MSFLRWLTSDKFSGAVQGFEVFLSSLVSHESSNFPRGLTFSASQQQIPRSRGLASIPSFLHDQFESNQKPGNRSSLAGNSSINQSINHQVFVATNLLTLIHINALEKVEAEEARMWAHYVEHPIITTDCIKEGGKAMITILTTVVN